MNRQWSLSALGLVVVFATGLPAQTPPPAFDINAMRAAVAAFNKLPDTPGTGKYPALKEMVASLPDHVIYRPADLAALGTQKLGLLVWGNGGCAADGAGARLHLEEIASHGYLAIANGTILSGPGAPPPAPEAAMGQGPAPAFKIPPPATQASQLTEAIDWALAENKRPGSAYFGRINPKWIAVSGYSCGGLQALEVAADPRISTVIIHSSGIFPAGASPIPGLSITKSALQKIHTPIIYILGGPTDIAYTNGMDDFSQISSVPAFVANIDVGHAATFMQPNGGAEASVAVSWLDWQFKGDATAARRFVGPECGLCKDPAWKVQSKNLPTGGAQLPAARVKIASGVLEGAQLPGGGAVFKGVPYAAAPLGALRWHAPEPVAAWSAARPALAYGAACMQPDQGWNSSLIATASEDCLYLNVWTPALKPAAHLPVMVWIHGGAFVGGSGTDAMFKGDELIKRGVILVTLNYRLGIFGFLAHPQLSRESVHHSSGNFALEDQLAALHWVRTNIAAFGGDAGNITLFGQSAGGMSVMSLLSSPLTRGQFRRAVIESGSILGGAPMKSLGEAEALGTQFAGSDDLSALRALSAADLMQRFGAFMAGHREARFGPIVDHYVLDEDPAASFQHGQEHAVPLMIGNNAREGFGRIPEEALPKVIEAAYGADAPAALALYGLGNGAAAPIDPLLGSAAAQWLTDTSFRCGALITAKRHAATGSSVYEYQFEQSLPGREAEGAAHTYELPYVFDNLLPDGPLGAHFTAMDQALANTMSRYWTNFAKRSDPNGPQLPYWPTFTDPADSYLRLSASLPDTAVAARGLRKSQCALYEAHLARAHS